MLTLLRRYIHTNITTIKTRAIASITGINAAGIRLKQTTTGKKTNAILK